MIAVAIDAALEPPQRLRLLPLEPRDRVRDPLAHLEAPVEILPLLAAPRHPLQELLVEGAQIHLPHELGLQLLAHQRVHVVQELCPLLVVHVHRLLAHRLLDALGHRPRRRPRVLRMRLGPLRRRDRLPEAHQHAREEAVPLLVVQPDRHHLHARGRARRLRPEGDARHAGLDVPHVAHGRVPALGEDADHVPLAEHLPRGREGVLVPAGPRRAVLPPVDRDGPGAA